MSTADSRRFDNQHQVGAIYTYSAERVIPAVPAHLPAAIDEVVRAVWGSRAARINDDQPARTYAVAGVDGASPDVWLSFRVMPTGPASHVRVTLDEFSSGPDPTEQLRDLLDLVAAAVWASTATTV